MFVHVWFAVDEVSVCVHTFMFNSVGAIDDVCVCVHVCFAIDW